MWIKSLDFVRPFSPSRDTAGGLPPPFDRRAPLCPGPPAGRTAREGCFLATYTTNYQLHQWEASDDFLRTDFNEDFAKIDAVIRSAVETAQAKPEVIAGSYSGNSGENREIALGFRPKAVILFCREYDSVMAYEGRPRLSHTGDKTMLTTTDNGFQVYYGSYSSGLNTYDYRPVTNKSGEEYRYLAVK